MSGEAQLEALLDIINSSACQVIAEYRNTGNSIPIINSTKLHPLNSAIDTVELRKVIHLLEGACQQLCASLAPPQQTVTNLSEMAGLDGSQLACVLHQLTSKGCFLEVDKDIFVINCLSLVTKSTHNLSCSIYCIMEKPFFPLILLDTLMDPEYKASHETGTALLIFAQLKLKDVGTNYFDLLKEDHFHRTMISFGEVMGSLLILYHGSEYPWNDVSTVYDVSCGIGTFGIPLVKAYPHLRIMNQDLEHVIIQAKEVWGNKVPEVLQEQCIDFVALNFLVEAPISRKDVYYVHCHICLRAMAPHSCLLIYDYIVTNSHHPDLVGNTGTDVPPEPMLPNFGVGNAHLFVTDIAMLVLNNGKECTLNKLITLVATARLCFNKAYDLGGTTVLEFRLT
ncbi:hypothetical protein V8B97DRAFT_2026540 [Scleroderma yunnanense]